MPETQYVYAVARIRSKELSLINNQFLDQLLAAKSYEECLQLLAGKGWGNSEGNINAETFLSAEREKTWNLIAEMVKDMSVFDVFLYANDYHNLKAAIKIVCTDSKLTQAFISHGTVDAQIILKAINERDYTLLPEHMREAAQEALQTLLHTRDGQLCDIIIDKAALDAIYAAGKSSEDDLIRDYAELTVAAADIKIAVRSQKTAKSIDFVQRALAACDSLDVDTLARAAVSGFDDICEYLTTTSYESAVQALRESPSAFERWCDNLIIEKMRPQKYNPFSIGPLAAYILAKENEIKTVRIILSGKLNELPTESMRERLREMYV